MKGRVWHPLNCQRTAYQFSSSPSHLCHLIFLPIRPLFHISFLSLCCLSLLLFPLFVFLSVSCSLYIVLLISFSLVSCLPFTVFLTDLLFACILKDSLNIIFPVFIAVILVVLVSAALLCTDEPSLKPPNAH